MRMILLVLGVMLSFGAVGQSEFDAEEAHKSRLEMAVENKRLSTENEELKLHLDEKYKMLKRLEHKISSLATEKEKSDVFLLQKQRQIQELNQKLKTEIQKLSKANNTRNSLGSNTKNIPKENQETVEQQLDSVYQNIDFINIRLQKANKEYRPSQLNIRND